MRPLRLDHLPRTVAASRPEAVAVVDGERRVSYGDLVQRADRVARLLVELGVERGDRVGVHAAKSADAVTGLYGVMTAGAAYVPLDPDAPVSRVATVAADAGIRHLLCDRSHAGRVGPLAEAGVDLRAVIALDGDPPAAENAGVDLLGPADIERQPDGPPDRTGIDQDLAYLLYTSGSTGRPKGVSLTHRNALSFVEWAAGAFAVGGADTLSSHAPFHFDLSVFDLYAAAHGGATVALVPIAASVLPGELARWVEEREITVWYSVPSILTMLVLGGGLSAGAWPRLRAVLFAGEVFPTGHLRRLMELVPHASFHNLYGPTETNVCTHYPVPRLDPEREEPIPIGRPIEGMEVFVWTAEGREAGVGEVGEILVRGGTVMRGYWNDPERTGEVLVPDPRGATLPDPVYRTGDIGHWDERGDLVFLGRRDHQVKTRGYRVELGEVEATLYAHPAVVECAVVAVPDPVVTNRLRAFVVAGRALDPADLARFVEERLPRYMVPDSFVPRAALPRTSSGKVDRRALLDEPSPSPPTSTPSEGRPR